VRCRKYYFDGGQVEIAAELVHELDSTGNCSVSSNSPTTPPRKCGPLCASPDELRARWADAGQRADIIQQLAERGIDFQQVAAQAGSRTPTRSTCCATSPSTRPCSPAASAPTAEATTRCLLQNSSRRKPAKS